MARTEGFTVIGEESLHDQGFIVVVSMPGTAEHFTKSFEDSATIGRAKESDIELAHPLVSRRHAEVAVSGDGFRIWDLGSSNGTTVNGKVIRDSALELDGEVNLQIGPYLLAVSRHITGENETILLDRRAATRLTLDSGIHTLLLDGKPVIERLSVLEFRLLDALQGTAPNVIENQALGDQVWGANEWDVYMLHNLIRRVRRKLEDIGAPAESLLVSVPGVGYRLA